MCQVGKGSIVLAGFVCQLDTSCSYHRERSFSREHASMRSLVGGAIPVLVVSGSIEELAEQGRESKTVKKNPTKASTSPRASCPASVQGLTPLPFFFSRQGFSV